MTDEKKSAPNACIPRLCGSWSGAPHDSTCVESQGPATRTPWPAITHVAIRWDGRVWSLPKPFRHHHIIQTISRLTGATTIDCCDSRGDQGFLDASGQYLDRKQALVRALTNDQVLDPNDIRAGMLFSEDVW